MFHRRRSDTPATRGQAMVEFALVAPLMALFIVIAIDFGRAFFSYVQITNGAREALVLASDDIAGPTNLTAMRDRVLLEANEQDHAGEDSSIQVTTVACHDPAGTEIDCAGATQGPGAGNTVTIIVTRDFSLITPLASSILGDAFQMSTTATSPVLGFVSAGGPGGGGGCTTPVASFQVIVVNDLTVAVNPAASSPQDPGDPCNISGYNWTWGDGSEPEPGSATAAEHTFGVTGTYTIRLTVTNQAGSATTTHQVTVPEGAPVTCDPPNASFTVSEGGSGNKTHTYTDTSTVADQVNCPIVAWQWTFPDGTSSNAPNPTKTYGSNSAHTVTLQVTNSGGSDTFSSNH
jgi:Flp pilus assembly protein TadG